MKEQFISINRKTYTLEELSAIVKEHEEGIEAPTLVLSASLTMLGTSTSDLLRKTNSRKQTSSWSRPSPVLLLKQRSLRVLLLLNRL